MSAVAPPARWADATNSNAASAGTRAAAGYPAGGWLVKADASRSETLEGFQIADLCALFQGAFRGAASALNRGSEMDERVKQYCDEVANEVGQSAALVARQDVDRAFGAFDYCESEIERLFMAALLRVEALDCPRGYAQDFEVIGAVVGPLGGDSFDAIRNYALADLKSLFEGGWRTAKVFAFPQVCFGSYRVDFLLGYLRYDFGRDEMPVVEHWIVAECDGHDFHDRTKEQARRDKARDRFLVASGVKVMRFTGAEIWRDPTACAAEVLKALAPHRFSGVGGCL